MDLELGILIGPEAAVVLEERQHLPVTVCSALLANSARAVGEEGAAACVAHENRPLLSVAIHVYHD